MKQSEREQLKEYLLELDEDIKLDEENEDKLIGYAERFGGSFIPLYKDVNTFLFNDPEEAMDKAEWVSSFPVGTFPGLENCMVGYIVIEDGRVAMLHDKEKYLDDLSLEYEADGMEIDEDDSYYSQALQWYEYNVLGTGLSDRTTPAFACTEEFSLPVALDS